MKSLLLAASATLPLLTGVPAQAADMVRAPLNKALPPATYSWTGLYVGGHLGTGWANNDWENLDFAGGSAPRIGTGTGTGFLGGAQAGVNRQLDAMVFGIEADVSWAVLSGDACHLGGGIPLCNSRADRFGTVAGRFGVVADRALVYLKGGAAWLHSTHVFSATAMATGTGSKWGWTAGAGVEYGLTRNWSAKLEYDLMDFGTSHILIFDSASNPVATTDIKQNIQTVKFGLNYKFDWTGPVNTSY